MNTIERTNLIKLTNDTAFHEGLRGIRQSIGRGAIGALAVYHERGALRVSSVSRFDLHGEQPSTTGIEQALQPVTNNEDGPRTDVAMVIAGLPRTEQVEPTADDVEFLTKLSKHNPGIIGGRLVQWTAPAGDASKDGVCAMHAFSGTTLGLFTPSFDPARGAVKIHFSNKFTAHHIEWGGKALDRLLVS